MKILFRTLAGISFGVAAAEHAVPTHDVIAARTPRFETGFERDHLTGDWNGMRTRLVEQGIHLSAGYTGEVISNLEGGMRRGAIYEGIFELGVELDFEKLGFWDGALLKFSAINLHGASPTAKLVGDFFAVSSIDAYDSFRLYELWYEQNFFEDQFSLRLGNLLADDEFAGTENGGVMMNAAFGWPAFISANTVNTGPAFFVTAPGARLRYQPAKSVYIQAALFDGDSFDDANGNPRTTRYGTHWELNSGQGVFAISEAGFGWNSEDAYPGILKLGVWGHSADFSDNYLDEAGIPIAISGGNPRIHEGNYGGYLVAEQKLYAETEAEGLGAWGRVGASPPDRGFFEYSFDFGLNYTGLLPGREEDILATGFVYARISKDIVASERLSGMNPLSDYEAGWEITYMLQVSKWLSVQPDLQIIFHPGGSSALDNAIVAGVRFNLVF
ncbi:MAG: carbohydrate porin [Verrucomicrobiota bacterium]|nr:carbohydrate porin [Verrucomicrobiota bacterium]